MNTDINKDLWDQVVSSDHIEDEVSGLLSSGKSDGSPKKICLLFLLVQIIFADWVSLYGFTYCTYNNWRIYRCNYSNWRLYQPQV